MPLTLTGEQYSQKQERLKFKNVIQSGKLLVRTDMGQYYRLQNTESGCIVPAQKNSGNRS